MKTFLNNSTAISLKLNLRGAYKNFVSSYFIKTAKNKTAEMTKISLQQLKYISYKNLKNKCYFIKKKVKESIKPHPVSAKKKLPNIFLFVNKRRLKKWRQSWLKSKIFVLRNRYLKYFLKRRFSRHPFRLQFFETKKHFELFLYKIFFKFQTRTRNLWINASQNFYFYKKAVCLFNFHRKQRFLFKPKLLKKTLFNFSKINKINFFSLNFFLWQNKKYFNIFLKRRFLWFKQQAVVIQNQSQNKFLLPKNSLTVVKLFPKANALNRVKQKIVFRQFSTKIKHLGKVKINRLFFKKDKNFYKQKIFANKNFLISSGQNIGRFSRFYWSDNKRRYFLKSKYLVFFIRKAIFNFYALFYYYLKKKNNIFKQKNNFFKKGAVDKEKSKFSPQKIKQASVWFLETKHVPSWKRKKKWKRFRPHFLVRLRKNFWQNKKRLNGIFLFHQQKTLLNEFLDIFVPPSKLNVLKKYSGDFNLIINEPFKNWNNLYFKRTANFLYKKKYNWRQNNSLKFFKWNHKKSILKNLLIHDFKKWRFSFQNFYEKHNENFAPSYLKKSRIIKNKFFYNNVFRQGFFYKKKIQKFLFNFLHFPVLLNKNKFISAFELLPHKNYYLKKFIPSLDFSKLHNKTFFFVNKKRKAFKLKKTSLAGVKTRRFLQRQLYIFLKNKIVNWKKKYFFYKKNDKINRLHFYSFQKKRFHFFSPLKQFLRMQKQRRSFITKQEHFTGLKPDFSKWVKSYFFWSKYNLLSIRFKKLNIKDSYKFDSAENNFLRIKRNKILLKKKIYYKKIKKNLRSKIAYKKLFIRTKKYRVYLWKQYIRAQQKKIFTFVTHKKFNQQDRVFKNSLLLKKILFQPFVAPQNIKNSFFSILKFFFLNLKKRIYKTPRNEDSFIGKNLNIIRFFPHKLYLYSYAQFVKTTTINFIGLKKINKDFIRKKFRYLNFSKTLKKIQIIFLQKKNKSLFQIYKQKKINNFFIKASKDKSHLKKEKLKKKIKQFRTIHFFLQQRLIKKIRVLRKRSFFKKKLKFLSSYTKYKNKNVSILKKSQKFRSQIQIYNFSAHLIRFKYRQTQFKKTRIFYRKWFRRNFKLKTFEYQKYAWMESILFPKTLYKSQRKKPFRRRQFPQFTKKNQIFYFYRSILFNKWDNQIRRSRLFKSQISLNKILMSFYGGLQTSQFRYLVKKISRMKPKKNARTSFFLDKLERRLDVIIYRMNLAPTIQWARNLINDNLVSVDGKIINSPFFLVKNFQLVQISQSFLLYNTIKKQIFFPKFFKKPIPSYLIVNKKINAGIVIGGSAIEDFMVQDIIQPKFLNWSKLSI